MLGEITNKIIEATKETEKELMNFLLKNKAPCNHVCLRLAGYELKNETIKMNACDILEHYDIYKLYRHGKFIDSLVLKQVFKFNID